MSRSAYSPAAGLAPTALNMAAAIPAAAPNMAAAIPGGAFNMAAAIPVAAPNMAAAIPSGALNMAAAIPVGALNMAGAIAGSGSPALLSVQPGASLSVVAPPLTGAGDPSGHGFLGGYGVVPRSEYATPWALGPVNWALDFTFGNGWEPFPLRDFSDPSKLRPVPQWDVNDWDPGLRFWTLPFDPRLTEWLQDVNLAAPSVLVAREFAARHALWKATPDVGPYATFMVGGHVVTGRRSTPAPVPELSGIQGVLYGDGDLLDWYLPDDGSGYADDATDGNGRPVRALARALLQRDMAELQDLMRDDRERYLAEAQSQSASLAVFFTHLLGMDPAAKPWTRELMDCAAAIGNLVKMHYKSVYRRLRPSTLCPGLAPPWGPPQHPAFPSGHSMVAHLMALFLLRIPYLHRRFGVLDPGTGLGREPRLDDFVHAPGGAARPHDYGANMRSPLLWLAWRLAHNRERIGVHYPTDSRASRLLAAAVCASIWSRDEAGRRYRFEPAGRDVTLAPIRLPALQSVLDKAIAEWPAPWSAAGPDGA